MHPQSQIDQQQPHLHPDTHMGPASLTIANLDRSVPFSSIAIGLAILERTEQTAVLGTRDGQAKLPLGQQEGARPQLPYTTRLYHIDEVAKAAVFLASDESSFVNGIELGCNPNNIGQ